MTRGARASGLALGLATAWCRAEAQVYRRGPQRGIADALQRFTAAACGHALSRHEKGRLTLAIYNASPIYPALEAQLFTLEAVLFGRELPAPPARVLVGACGTGREALALAALGYEVHAFDPAPAFAAESRRRLGPATPVQTLSYEQLSASVLDAAPTAPALASERYDAVVLGCGSLSHVLEPHEHHRLIHALQVLCPTGPLIASFLWSADELADAPMVGRAARWGGRIGRAVAGWRGLARDVSPRLSYQAERGFAYTFTQHEVERLAAAVGRRVIWERDAARASLYASFVRA